MISNAGIAEALTKEYLDNLPGEPQKVKEPKDYKSIVILTGAGISAESGIETFRDGDGLWENHKVEDVACYDGFKRDRNLVNNFYNAYRKKISGTGPNIAHKSLAHLQNKFDGPVTIITQNIDDFHQRAGSKLYQMHGDIFTVKCEQSFKVFPVDGDITPETKCVCCNKINTLRPNIVWFGELPYYPVTIKKRIRGCDLFISIGTSGNVYPAAGFVQEANYFGAHTVEINLDKALNHKYFKENIYGLASIVVPKFVEELIKQIKGDDKS